VRKNHFYRAYGKRWFDLTITVPLLIVALPLLGLIMLLVRLRLGSPVFFKQQRPGYQGKPFTILKFRTMTDDRDAEGKLLADSERMTSFGRFLRGSSLDELPELLNVLRGNMSLVGPRPLLMAYLDLYTPEQMRRHDVPPGITGYAQISGRNALSWEDRFELDLWYVEHLSLWLDLQVLFKTIWKVIQREGISQTNHVTMTEFTGSSESVRDIP
jgi:sugar transferase EpsL